MELCLQLVPVVNLIYSKVRLLLNSRINKNSLSLMVEHHSSKMSILVRFQKRMKINDSKKLNSNTKKIKKKINKNNKKK